MTLMIVLVARRIAGRRTTMRAMMPTTNTALSREDLTSLCS
jgi:hypothetical protein